MSINSNKRLIDKISSMGMINMEIKETKSEMTKNSLEYQKVQEKETEEKSSNPEEILDILKNMEQEEEKIKKAFQVKKKVCYRPGRDMAAITNAAKSGQLRMISARLRSEAAKIKRSGGDSREVACAVAKIKKLLKKADVKMRKLMVEEQIESERQKAEKKNELEREKELAKELCLKRKKRKMQEEQDMMEFRQGRGANYVSGAEIEMELRNIGSSFQMETAVEASIAGETISLSDTDGASPEEGSTSVDITL